VHGDATPPWLEQVGAPRRLIEEQKMQRKLVAKGERTIRLRRRERSGESRGDEQTRQDA
jgi:hypothetical protein